MRPAVMVTGHCGSGLEVDRGDAGSVTDEEDFDVPAGEFFVSAFNGPWRGNRAELVVLDQFDGHVTERLVRKVSGYVRKVAGSEAGFTVGELEIHGRFVDDLVGHVRVAQSDEHVIVAMPVQQRSGVGRYLDLEDSDVLVLKHEVMRGFGSDLDLGSSAECGEQGKSQQRSDKDTLHAGGF